MKLTADSSPEDVLAMAEILARTRSAWGALETDDFIGTACLAFYQQRDHVAATARDFHNLMVRVMVNAMRQQTRKELRQYGKDDRPLKVASHPRLCVRASRVSAGGCSASSHSQLARHRRLAAQRENNRTYYYRHVGLGVCAQCGAMANRGGHGSRFCQPCADARLEARTQARVQIQKSRCRPCRACGDRVGKGGNRVPGYCRPCGRTQEGAKAA